MNFLRVMALLMMVSPLSQGQVNDEIHERRITLSDFNYICSVNGADGKALVQPQEIRVNAKNDPIPGKSFFSGTGANRIQWSVTRLDGMVSAEVKNSQGQVVSISTVEEGQPIEVAVPGLSSTLVCPAPKIAMMSPRLRTANPNYTCRAASYVSEQSEDIKELHNLSVKNSDDFSVLDGANRLSISFRRQTSGVAMEVRDNTGKLVTVSKTGANQDLALQIPGTKIIANCVLEGIGRMLGFDPQHYGESMTINPRHYGATIQIIERPDLTKPEAKKKKGGGTDK